MAIITNSANAADLTIESKSAWSIIRPRGTAYSAFATTGTVAAALAANSSVFAMRLNPGAGAIKAYISRIRVQYNCIVPFTTPVTAGRRLELYRGAGATASGGTALNLDNVGKNSNYAASQFATASGGDARIAATGALTVTGITFESQPFRGISLVQAGTAGAFADAIWEFNATESAELELNAGQVLAIRTPVLFDAAGTWTLGVTVDWFEI